MSNSGQPSSLARIERELQEVYGRFFAKLGIDAHSGILGDTERRFATMPFVGTRYDNDILIVGMDIGYDGADHILSFDERRDFEDRPRDEHNPHIAGTYFTAVFFLKERARAGDPDLKDFWEKYATTGTFKRILSRGGFFTADEFNPLSHIALTNYHKFVTVDRKNLAGGQDRVDIRQEEEDALLLEEIRILDPKIVVFQGRYFDHPRFHGVMEKITGRKVFILPHPSHRQKGGRIPENYMGMIHEFGT